MAIVEEMKRLAEKGVPVITVDGDINGKLFSDARPFYIGTDNSIAGRLLGTAAKKVLESRGVNEGGFIQFTGFTDNDNARARMNGCRDALGKKYNELDRMADSFDHSRARDNVRTALVNHPDVNGRASEKSFPLISPSTVITGTPFSAKRFISSTIATFSA